MQVPTALCRCAGGQGTGGFMKGGRSKRSPLRGALFPGSGPEGPRTRSTRLPGGGVCTASASIPAVAASRRLSFPEADQKVRAPRARAGPEGESVLQAGCSQRRRDRCRTEARFRRGRSLGARTFWSAAAEGGRKHAPAEGRHRSAPTEGRHRTRRPAPLRRDQLRARDGRRGRRTATAAALRRRRVPRTARRASPASARG